VLCRLALTERTARVIDDRRRFVILEQERDPFTALARLRPRDADFVRVESADLLTTRQIVARLTPEQCLVASAATGPLVWRTLVEQLGEDDDTVVVCELLRGPFPPMITLPTLGEVWLNRLRPIAQGQPGDPVTHGLFPGRLTKLARLALARAGAYPEALVWQAAEQAYRSSRPYHAHDALACAIVDRRLNAGPLLRAYLGDTARQRGWRSRRKTWALARWAQHYGYLLSD
jgi:hypothetical protein